MKGNNLKTNIQTHRSIPASTDFLRPTEPWIKFGTLGLKNEHANINA